ncbi:MAG: glycoside hydrolase family 127 protein [Bacteroidetes bacterium]|nr:glycoside hydrolase family 127 protein [Bacteroidota bacterium]MBS1931372.1 glycoside hydrolase family 127 protein [Bacteroidota bacterium]
MVSQVKKSKALQKILLGGIKPEGWIKKQMQRDLSGFVGHLDQLIPELFIDDKIYGKNRLTKKIRKKSVGNIQGEDEWSQQYLWWNSESQSNWFDGFLRHAYLLYDKKSRSKVDTYIKYILNTQDKDGYIGIYAPDLRYNFTGENGELWSKTTLYRALLAYYEVTKNKKILEAVIRAVQNVMDHYPVHSSSPFSFHKPYAGVSHGLMFTDILNELFFITGKKIYLNYAVFLYRDYCRQDVSEKDIQLKNILNKKYKLCGHGVHTYEHIRSLASAFFATGDLELKKALSIYLKRIETTTTVSGGPVGDEWISKRNANATSTGYEYCSMQELMHSYLFLLQKTGELQFADQVEKIFFNAAQGARNPEQDSIAYLKTDNSYEMCGTKNGEKDEIKKQTRYKYSPVHQDVAVCCSPNAGRITPYFVQNMWMKDEEGLVCCLFGPCESELSFNGKRIFIKETTSYPFEFSIHFEITVETPINFVLKIRKPDWAKKMQSNIPCKKEKDFISIHKLWKKKEIFQITFEPELKTNFTQNKEVYFSYGPLILALPIKAKEKIIKEYKISGFCDTHYKPVSLKQYEYRNGKIKKKSGQLVFETEFLNIQSGKKETVSLIPIGKTILRQVTFKNRK